MSLWPRTTFPVRPKQRVPTFERHARFDREFRRLSRELQTAFLAMLPAFIAALRADPPAFPPVLRVKRVQGVADVWEITFAPDGRATLHTAMKSSLASRM